MTSLVSATEEIPTKHHVSTMEAARMLGLAVRSVQLMVDRGELDAWKTPGGHRRITLDSVQRWGRGERPAANGDRRQLSSRHGAHGGPHGVLGRGSIAGSTQAPRVLLIEDSVHYQNMVRLLLEQKFPDIDLQVANDGISGLVMTGQFQPDLLLVDILLPGIDGATLITGLRSLRDYQQPELIVVTSLDAEQLQSYAFALAGLPVVHKPRLVEELPPLVQHSLEQRQGARGMAA